MEEKVSNRQRIIFLIRTLKRFHRIFLSIVANFVYGFPLANVKVIGITGTSGKTTTTTMIYEILKSAGYKVAMISTVEAKMGDFSIDTGFHVTTPDPIKFKKITKEFKKRNMEFLVVEASSHSLDQGRLGLTKFIRSVFTNIQRDHLDYHFAWKEYAKAKGRLILKTSKNGVVIINQDDMSFKFLENMCKLYNKNFLSYTKSQIDKVELTSGGISFVYSNHKFVLPIFGEYNINNALAAIKLAESLGISLNTIQQALLNFRGVEGRMQIMQETPFKVIVDFAHNTDSIIKALEYLQKIKMNRIISVFGSAGLRDVEKRFTMGQASSKFADVTIITSEDPRTEKLYDINSRIIEGCISSGGKLIHRFANHNEYIKTNMQFLNEDIHFGSVFSFDEESVDSRYDAIEFAIKIAKPGDIVVTFGKGHEKSLCFGTIEYPFTDQDAVKRAINNINK